MLKPLALAPSNPLHLINQHREHRDRPEWWATTVGAVAKIGALLMRADPVLNSDRKCLNATVRDKASNELASC